MKLKIELLSNDKRIRSKKIKNFSGQEISSIDSGQVD